MKILFFCIGITLGCAAAKLQRWLLVRYHIWSLPRDVEKVLREENLPPHTPANEQPAEKLRAGGEQSEYLRVYKKARKAQIGELRWEEDNDGGNEDEFFRYQPDYEQ